MQEKGRKRSKPHAGHLNATEYRGRDAGDALVPVSAEAECRGGTHDEGEAEPAVHGGVALLVGSLELGEAAEEEPAHGIGSPGMVDGAGVRTGRQADGGLHKKGQCGGR